MPNSIKELLSQLLPLHHAEQERLKKEKEERQTMVWEMNFSNCSL